MTAEEQELLEFLQDNGYQGLRLLPDGTIIGTLELMFTRSLCVDIDRYGWAYRFCYEDRELATRACATLKSGDHAPLPGYVATRMATLRAHPMKADNDTDA